MLTVTRQVTLPDRFRLERYRRVPEFGPRLLFFTGGSALREVSTRLTEFTHNSIHLVTPFDSGGSSAVIRDAFDMLSVGDLRNRLMALADQAVRGNPSVYRLFAHRFSSRTDAGMLKEELERMARGKHNLVDQVPNPMRRIIRNHLHYFLERMPLDFDLRGASIGNLVLTGGYLNNRRHIDPVVFMFSKLITAQGIVKPITGGSYHLAAELSNGEVVAGQHRITQKAMPTLKHRINRVFLTNSLNSVEPVRLQAKPPIRELIQSAELICFPMGSYFSSVTANLLAEGIGRTVVENQCPKIYTPNPTPDPETNGWTLCEQVENLVGALRTSGSNSHAANRVLDYVLVDSSRGDYGKSIGARRIEKLGVRIIDTRLVTDSSQPLFDPSLYVEALLSFT